MINDNVRTLSRVLQHIFNEYIDLEMIFIKQIKQDIKKAYKPVNF